MNLTKNYLRNQRFPSAVLGIGFTSSLSDELLLKLLTSGGTADSSTSTNVPGETTSPKTEQGTTSKMSVKMNLMQKKSAGN